MKSKTINYFLACLVLATSSLLHGCKNSPQTRSYQEIFIDKKAALPMGESDPHAFMQNMPNDDIHAGMQNMPNDDIHAGLRTGNGPMPDDEIHAGLRSGGDMTMPPGMNASMFAVGSPTSIGWDSPSEWLEKKGSDMRLATFISTDEKSRVETSIISLPGQVGGLAANITRWMQQIKLDVPSEKDLENFISRQEKIVTKTGLKGTLFDFTQLQNSTDPQTPSMIAAIIESDNDQIFVKMTGGKQAVLGNLNPFRSLVGSIRKTATP